MAKQVVKVGYVTLGGTDYSAQIANASLNIDVETGETTNYAGNGWKEFVQGLKSATLEIEFRKDAALSGLDAAINTAIAGTGILAAAVRLSSGAISTDNPEFQFNVLVTSWMEGPGALGQVYGGSVTWTVTGAIVRDTTP